MTFLARLSKGGVRTAIASLAILMVLAGGCASSSGPGGRLDKTDMQKKPSADFSLLDQNGATVSLSGLQGKVVALTFLYTSCPDVCPIIANTFGQAHDKLRDSRSRVAFVAVTVDPERDSVQRVNQYLLDQGLQEKMSFLTGKRPDLEKVWAAYYIGVSREAPDSGAGTDGGSYDVTHTNAVYLIDAHGRERTLIHGYEFTADQLIDEIGPLLSEVS